MAMRATRFHVRDWYRLPEGYPAQLIEGQLAKDAPPVPRHQRLVGRLYLAVETATSQAVPEIRIDLAGLFRV